LLADFLRGPAERGFSLLAGANLQESLEHWLELCEGRSTWQEALPLNVVPSLAWRA